MADACLSYDDHLTEATPWRPAVVAAARAQVTSARSTTARVVGRCTGAGDRGEI